MPSPNYSQEDRRTAKDPDNRLRTFSLYIPAITFFKMYKKIVLFYFITICNCLLLLNKKVIFCKIECKKIVVDWLFSVITEKDFFFPSK